MISSNHTKVTPCSYITSSICMFLLFIPLQKNGFYSAQNLGSGYYDITATDSNGCVLQLNTTITQPVQYRSEPNDNQFLVCSGGTMDFNIALYGMTPPYFWKLEGKDTEFILALYRNYTAIPAGRHQLAFMDQNSCLGTFDLLVDEYPPIVGNPTITGPVCPGDTASIYVTFTGGTKTFKRVMFPNISSDWQYISTVHDVARYCIQLLTLMLLLITCAVVFIPISSKIAADV